MVVVEEKAILWQRALRVTIAYTAIEAARGKILVKLGAARTA